MSPKKYYTFMIEPALADVLKHAKKLHNRPESEIIREALVEWLQKRGLAPTAAAAVEPITPEISAALEELARAITEAQAHQEIDDVVVPVVLGKACGGGKRLGILKSAQLEALGELNARNSREQASRSLKLAGAVKRED